MAADLFRKPASRRDWALMGASALWAAGAVAAAIALDDHGAPRRSEARGEPPLQAATPSPHVPRLVAAFVDPPPDYPTSLPERIDRHETTIPRRGTLVDTLIDAGAPRREAHLAAAALRGRFDVRGLKAGQAVSVLTHAPEESPEARAVRLDPAVGEGLAFHGFELSPAPERTVRVTARGADGFEAVVSDAPLEEKPAFASGRIATSLYEAGDAAGLPRTILAELIRLYSFDVDFQREIRPGDRFEVLYTNHHLPDGRPAKAGDVLYASLSVRGEPKAYYRFEPPGLGRLDHFDADGASARKFLMRTPVDGARLSSGFGKRRHPVLGYAKNHWGVDFAAPTGTPIMAAGDGVVERAGRWGTYGHYIRIRHANGYKTAYAHLNGYAKGIRAGRRVRQGEIIGYVGATGRVTGPHLHYEVYKGENRVNPMRLRVPTGVKLAGSDLAAFQEARARLDAIMSPLKLAAAGEGERADTPTTQP